MHKHSGTFGGDILCLWYYFNYRLLPSAANIVLVYTDMGVGNNPSQFSYRFFKSEYKKRHRQRYKMRPQNPSHWAPWVESTVYHYWQRPNYMYIRALINSPSPIFIHMTTLARTPNHYRNCLVYKAYGVYNLKSIILIHPIFCNIYFFIFQLLKFTAG